MISLYSSQPYSAGQLAKINDICHRCLILLPNLQKSENINHYLYNIFARMYKWYKMRLYFKIGVK